MNAVASLSRVYRCAPDVLFAALENREAWWGDQEPAEVLKAEPPAKLTLAVSAEGEPTRAMLVLSGADQGTELMVMHTRFASGEARDAHAAHWETRLDRLEALLSDR